MKTQRFKSTPFFFTSTFQRISIFSFIFSKIFQKIPKKLLTNLPVCATVLILLGGHINQRVPLVKAILSFFTLTKGGYTYVNSLAVPSGVSAFPA
nr:hypothetical protein [uncultured Schaedlerella sp.]